LHLRQEGPENFAIFGATCVYRFNKEETGFYDTRNNRRNEKKQLHRSLGMANEDTGFVLTGKMFA